LVLREETKIHVSGSVADPGCLSRIPNPDFDRSRISDPFSVFLFSHKYHKTENYFFLNGRKKFGPNYKVGLFTPKNQIVIKLSKIKVRDPGSEIRKKHIPGAESRIRGRKGIGSRIRNTGLRCTSSLNKP
jgi:hypothetical protein